MFASANANASIQDSLANICNIVKSNDKSELRKKMKTVRSNFKLRLNDYYDGISCDGNSLIKTALLNEAVDTGKLLVKKLPKSRLASPDTDGVVITTWIQSNGLDGSPIASAISERL
ncbi:MAG: DUF3718 domain-containing protein [Glaciecola sp.]